MGQAKQRGTFEQRKEEAVSRNTEVAMQLTKMPHEMQSFARRKGVHRLGVVLALAGMAMTTRRS